MGRPRGWASQRTGRPMMPSPGRPGVNQLETKKAFWKCIAEGMESEGAALACGMSRPLGPRWFREAGGMAPKPIAGPNVPWKGRRHGRRADRRWGTCWSPEQISRRLQVAICLCGSRTKPFIRRSTFRAGELYDENCPRVCVRAGRCACHAPEQILPCQATVLVRD